MPVSESSISSIASEPPIEEDPGYFIFIDYLLVGSYHDNQWHTIESRDLSVADLLSQEAYYSYIEDEINIIKSVSFCYICDFDFSFKDDPTPLFPYASKNNTDRYFITFNLPCKIPQELRYIRFRSYNMNMYFDGRCSSVVLSADFDPYSKTGIKKLTEPYSESDKAAVKAELERLGVPGAPVNITDCFEFDYDNDGIIEHFVIANAPRDETGYVYVSPEEYENDQSGYYYIVLCKDQTGYKTVASWCWPYLFSERASYKTPDATATQYIELIDFSDLNNDGVFELCLYDNEWEGEEIFVYSQNSQNEWECVLTGSGGM